MREEESNMNATTIGLDIAKQVKVHGVNPAGKTVHHVFTSDFRSPPSTGGMTKSLRSILLADVHCQSGKLKFGRRSVRVAASANC